MLNDLGKPCPVVVGLQVAIKHHGHGANNMPTQGGDVDAHVVQGHQAFVLQRVQLLQLFVAEPAKVDQ